MGSLSRNLGIRLHGLKAFCSWLPSCHCVKVPLDPLTHGVKGRRGHGAGGPLTSSLVLASGSLFLLPLPLSRSCWGEGPRAGEGGTAPLPHPGTPDLRSPHHRAPTTAQPAPGSCPQGQEGESAMAREEFIVRKASSPKQLPGNTVLTDSRTCAALLAELSGGLLNHVKADETVPKLRVAHTA